MTFVIASAGVTAEKQIAFASLRDGHEQIYVVGSEGGEPRRLITDGHNNRRPVLSRDGRYVYFDSDRA